MCPGLNPMFKPLSLFIGLNAQLEIMNNQILGRTLFYMILETNSVDFRVTCKSVGTPEVYLFIDLECT